MSKQYDCDLCKKTFTQKIDFTRHQNKKTPCITLTEMENIIQTKEVKTDIKTSLINVFKNCLNILRDNEGLTGEKALRNMSYLLILKLLEPRFCSEINIDEYDYDFSHVDPDIVDKHKNKLLSIVRFSNLSKEKEEYIPPNMINLWDDILSEHPTTKNIFLKGKSFDIQRGSTYKKLISNLNSLDLVTTEYDVLGNAYEEVIQHVMTGKVFGQFFTQPLIKKMMVNLINPEIHADGKIDTCGDPTMGTGGFLITYLQHILQQAKTKNINPDWEFIKTEGLYGKEIEPDTYQLAVSNMLISSGKMFEQLERGDSIREPITRKFDNILANPPFGIKGLKYDDINDPLKSVYIPIKSDNAVSLFIQAIIYMLKINGKCAVVLPDGQDLFSKSNTTLVTIREYLLKTCDLKEVIYLPSGIFTYTNIKTCVFYFIKKKEGSDVLDTKIKIGKNKQETGRNYNFSKTHQTHKVKFYDYNPYEDIKNLLVEVPIEQLANNSYSLNYSEYMKDEVEESQYGDGISVKTLMELSQFMPKSKRQASFGKSQGQYKFYTSSSTCDKYCDEYDYEPECLIIGTGGNANIKYDNKFSCSADNFVIKINNLALTKYVYHYLYINIEILQKGFIGAGLQHISKEYLQKIKIPIPPLEKQKQIVAYLDFIYEKCVKTSNEKIIELKQLNKFCLDNQQVFGENIVKTLGEVTEIRNGIRIVKDQVETGEYPVLGGGGFTSFYTNNFTREGKTCKISREGMSLHNCVMILNEKYYLNSQAFTIKSKIESVKDEYLWYFLDNIKKQIFECGRGTAQKAIDVKEFKLIKIPVPSLERQKEIIEYCEYNDVLIKQIEKEIKQNKIQAQLFMNCIIKTISTKQDNIFEVDPIDVEHDLTGKEEKIPDIKGKIKILKKQVKK